MVTVTCIDGSTFQTTGAEMTPYTPDPALTAICNGSGGVLAVFPTAIMRFAVFS